MKLRTYYFIADDNYGQHGTYIQELHITLRDFREIEKTRTYNNSRGFITKDYIAALYYAQD